MQRMPTPKDMREHHRLTLIRGADARHTTMAAFQLEALRVLLTAAMTEGRADD
jgi:hypothetical protein